MDQRDCQTDEIASYLDNELDGAALTQFEGHLGVCARCRDELSDQRRLLGTLHAALNQTSELSLPTNFAHVVAVNAESDMRGVRARREHGRALRLGALLAFASLALLGVATRTYVLGFARAAWRPFAIVLDLVWTTMYDAVTGLIVISRVISKGIFPESQLVGLLGFLLLALAILLLSRLITSYHRRASLID